MRVVWLFNHYALEPTASGGTRHYSLAKHALAHGLRVAVIAASTEYLTGRQRLADDEPQRLEEFDGVPFLWVHTPSYRGNAAGRMRNMLAYSLRVLRPRTLRELPKPDLVVGSSVHPFAALAAQRIAARYAVPFVFEVRDLWPETLIQMGRIERDGVMARVMRALERHLYNKADKIITLLPRAGDYIVPLGVAEDKITWISNGVDLDSFPYRSPVPRDDITFMYLGAHGQANGLTSVINAIARARRAAPALPIRFRFIGDGPLKAELIALSERLDVRDVVAFENPVGKHQIPALTATADAFLVNLRDLPLYRYGISLNKLFDYLAAGRPILFAGSPANNPVRDAGAGLTVAADDVEAIADAIVRIAEMPFDERVAMGSRGRQYVEAHFSYQVLGRRFSEILLSLMD